MKRTFIIWILFLLTYQTVMAQATCPAMDDVIRDLLDRCTEHEARTVCEADGTFDYELDDTADDAQFDDLITIESTSDEDEIASALLVWDDASTERMILVGDVSLTNTAPRQQIIVRALQRVNLRMSPSVEATVVGQLAQGRDYTAIGRLSDNTWIRVISDEDVTGWVSAQYFVTEDSFTELDAVTPMTPAYQSFQAFDLENTDCSGVLLMASHSDKPMIVGVNGTQITVNGVVWVQVLDDSLVMTSVSGEQVISAFGFEVVLEASEQSQVILSDRGSIAGVPSEAVAVEIDFVTDATIELLIGE